jgi:hypothetical protein
VSKKTITILLIAFIVLAGVFILQSYLSKPSSSLDKNSMISLSFTPDAVAAIQVFKQDYPDSGLTLAKKDTGWVVANEYGTPAKNEDVGKLLTDLNTVKGTLRGESEDLYTDFAIDEANALQIKLLGNDNSLLTHLFVGKGGPDGQTCFIRLPGSPNVYLADKNFISRFAAWNAAPSKKLPTDRWMNLNLSGLDRNSVNSVKLHTPKADYEFALQTEGLTDPQSGPKAWKQVLPAKSTLEESKIGMITGSIAGLAAQGVADPAFAGQYGLDNPEYSIWAADTLGHTALINFSNKIDTLEQRYATVMGRNTVYRVNKGTFERVFVTPFEKPKDVKQSAKK